MKFERAHQNKLRFVPKCFAHIQYLQESDWFCAGGNQFDSSKEHATLERNILQNLP